MKVGCSTYLRSITVEYSLSIPNILKDGGTVKLDICELL